jgi:hypothetical protein
LLETILWKHHHYRHSTPPHLFVQCWRNGSVAWS